MSAFTGLLGHREDLLAVHGAATPDTVRHGDVTVAGKEKSSLLRLDEVRTLFAGLALFALGYGGALLASWLWDQPSALQIGTDFNAFALLFVMALGIERLIQPISPWLGPDSSVAKAEVATAADEDEKKQKELEVEDARSKTAFVTWGLATGLACLAAMALNVTLLAAIVNPAGSQPPYWLDLLITGLAVGAGTKPLNDLWTRLQRKSATGDES